MKKILGMLVTLTVLATSVSYADAPDRCHMLYENHHWGGDHAIASVDGCIYTKVDMSTQKMPVAYIHYSYSGSNNPACKPGNAVIYVNSCEPVGDEDMVAGYNGAPSKFSGMIYKHDASIHLLHLIDGMTINAPLDDN